MEKVISVETPPVLLIIFKRYETTLRVFEAIRQARPDLLYIAADGPRWDRPGENELCQKTRSIVERIDWPCQVKTWFRDHNAGCRIGISQAITWFLDEVDEGVILEDDCLPHRDFFTYAGRLLAHYRHDERVMHISGSNFHCGQRWTSDSYYFSRYNHGWGWATWKRAWDKLDLDMLGLEDFLTVAERQDFWDSRHEQIYWAKSFRAARDQKVNAWDYQWKYSMWREGGLCLYPERNLISNLGFGEGATNTTHNDHKKGFLAMEGIGDWVDPKVVIRHRPADQANFTRMYWGSPSERLQNKFRKLLQLFGKSP